MSETLGQEMGLDTRARAPVAPFVRSLLSALIALWVIAALLSYLFDVRPAYTLASLGLLFSVQATYHARKLSRDPGYRIEGCNCGGAAADRTETVLTSPESRLLGVPNSMVGAVAYVTLLFLLYTGRDGPAALVAVLAVLASAYLAYAMVARVRALCSLCISTCAVNLWLVWYLLA